MLANVDMTGILIDTSGWGNMIDPNQPFHHQTVILYRGARQQKHQILTTNYVITEVVALLTSPLRIPRPQIIAFIQSLKDSPYIQILHIDSETDTQAWKLLSSRQDKAWSLVDCSSFVVMQQNNITEALTNDHHFEQAGFIRLLK
jgi:predicted nucleic acid-binding protein